MNEGQQILSFDYTVASLTAIVAAVLAVLVSFGAHLTQDNIHSVLLITGIVGGIVAAGGGAKDAALIHAQIKLPTWFRFSASAFIAGLATLISLIVTFALHMTQQNIDSVNTLVGLIAAGIVVGGAQVTNASIKAGVHPRLNKAV